MHIHTHTARHPVAALTRTGTPALAMLCALIAAGQPAAAAPSAPTPPGSATTGGDGTPATTDGGGTPAATVGDGVPAELLPPEGNRWQATFTATGVQVYGCTAGAWTFMEPVATLTGRVRGQHGEHTALHFRGPTWQSPGDGSMVEATAVASAPVAGAIPQLLLRARAVRGDGTFGRVTYIQRLDTVAGVAPTTACVDGETAAVGYRAEYRFFTAAETAAPVRPAERSRSEPSRAIR